MRVTYCSNIYQKRVRSYAIFLETQLGGVYTLFTRVVYGYPSLHGAVF